MRAAHGRDRDHQMQSMRLPCHRMDGSLARPRVCPIIAALPSLLVTCRLLLIVQN